MDALAFADAPPAAVDAHPLNFGLWTPARYGVKPEHAAQFTSASLPDVVEICSASAGREITGEISRELATP